MRGMPLPALPPAPPARGQIHGEAGTVNDTMFVEGLGRQVHPERRTKADSVLGAAAQFRIPPTHARLAGPDAPAQGSGEGRETTD